jgi:hypothetical protein
LSPNEEVNGRNKNKTLVGKAYPRTDFENLNRSKRKK